MKKQCPLERNDDITLEIHALNSEAQGVGRYEGFTVFVPFALPGETVEAHVIKTTTGYAVAKLTEVKIPSPHRIEPACPDFLRCGGCALLHLSYEEQLLYKQSRVQDALSHIAKLDTKVLPTLGMEYPLRSRNKASFPIANVDGVICSGFFAQRSHRVIPLSDCLIQSEESVKVMNAVCEFANTSGISAYDETTGRGVLRHVVVRTSPVGEVMVTVVTTTRLRHSERLIELLLLRVPSIVSIVHNINPDKTNVIFGKEFVTLYGDGCLDYSLCNLSFKVSSESFLQVNHTQAEVLYNTALLLLEPKENERIFDIYCGIGTISLMLAKACKEVIGIEYVKTAVDDARKNAERNGISNARFICAPAEKALPDLVKGGTLPDALLLDPPRKGCEPEVIDAIIKSNANRVVYVSCNPATLARDCALLAQGGYTAHCAQPVDMFAMSPHVETVVLMTR